MAPGQSPIRGVVQCQEVLCEVGFAVPTCEALAEGAHPENPDLEDDSPAPRVGWKRPASSSARRKCGQCSTRPSEHSCFPRGAPCVGSRSLVSHPPRKHDLTQSFRLLLLRRLHLPLPLTARRCRCGRLLDSYGHHHAACARVGVLGRRGFALETVAARVCREAGGRVINDQHARA